jgi:hypothetical protein
VKTETITAEQLIAVMPIVDYLPWRVVARHVRYAEDDHGAAVCPGCAVAEELGGVRMTDDVVAALAEIGVRMPPREVHRLTSAADDPDHPLHAALLHALGIAP